MSRMFKDDSLKDADAVMIIKAVFVRCASFHVRNEYDGPAYDLSVESSRRGELIAVIDGRQEPAGDILRIEVARGYVPEDEPPRVSGIMASESSLSVHVLSAERAIVYRTGMMRLWLWKRYKDYDDVWSDADPGAKYKMIPVADIGEVAWLQVGDVWDMPNSNPVAM